jgi:fluoroquinolone transport system permease protein
MIYIKAFNIIVLLPFVAFFVPNKFIHLFGLFPTHWIFQSVVNVTEGVSFVIFAVIGVFYFGGLMIWLSRLFVRKHFV